MYVAIMYKCNKERFIHLDIFLYRESLRNANSNKANFQKVQLKFNFFELLGNTEGFLDANSSYASSIYATTLLNLFVRFSTYHVSIFKNQNEHI